MQEDYPKFGKNLVIILSALVIVLWIPFSKGAASNNQERKGVNVVLTANWSPTPLVQELSEFLASEDSDLFWKFVGELAALSADDILSLESSTEEEQYNRMLQSVASLLSPIQLDLLHYSMGLRYYSPKVEMHRQLYSTVVGKLDSKVQNKINITESCQSGFALFKSNVFCTSSELQVAIKSGTNAEGTENQLYDFDRCLTIKDNLPSVVLFSTIGTKHFSDFHKFLQQASSEGLINYCLRHYVPQASGLLTLGGYGVELAIKSLEYKSMDDRKEEGEANSQEVTIDESEDDIQGFLFGTLQKRKPHLADELASFKSYLLSTDVPFEE